MSIKPGYLDWYLDGTTKQDYGWRYELGRWKYGIVYGLVLLWMYDLMWMMGMDWAM